jgi:antitoxin HicB
MSEKDLEYYMSLPYRVEIYPEPDGTGYTAVIPELPGCMTCADTLDELWDMVEEAKEGWLELSLEDGDYIPEPAPVEVKEYSGKFVVRLPTSLHRQLAKRAEQEETSLNQLIVMLLAEGMGRWSTRSRPTRVHSRLSRNRKPLSFPSS